MGRDADQAAIKKAYRKLAKKYHPDSNAGNARAEERFKEVTEAYDVLSNEKKRKLYDQYGHAAFEEGQAEGGAYGQDPFGRGTYEGAYKGPGGGWRKYHFTGSEGNAEDIFGGMFTEDFVGSGFGGFRGWDSRNSRGFYGGAEERAYRDKGSDVSAEVELTFDEAAFGGKKQFHLQDRSGELKSYEVSIPAGIESGKTIRLKGKGMPGAGGGAPGDLLLKVQVKDKPGFHREGMDVYTTVRIPFAIAALGGEAEVDTIYGKVLCKIKEGTQSGTKIRLGGKGIVSMSDPSRHGDQYTTVEIQVPRGLGAEAKQKLREFEQACGRPNQFGGGAAA